MALSMAAFLAQGRPHFQVEFLGFPWFFGAPATSQSLGEIRPPERIMGDREKDRREHASL